MNKAIITAIVVSECLANTNAQTPGIYCGLHKSKSTCNLKHLATSGMGMAPEPWVREAELKKVVLINDSTAVMETELSCHRANRPESRRKWSPGLDTVVNHPLFNKSKNEMEIRRELKATYFFANEIDSVELSGFQPGSVDVSTNQPDIDQKKSRKYKKQTTNDRHTGKWILLILVITSSAGLLKWR